jgi:hypothetical protein
MVHTHMIIIINVLNILPKRNCMQTIFHNVLKPNQVNKY